MKENIKPLNTGPKCIFYLGTLKIGLRYWYEHELKSHIPSFGSKVVKYNYKKAK